MAQAIFQPWDKYEQDLEILTERFFKGKFRELCYTKIVDFRVEYAYSEEPIPFEQAKQLSYQPIEIGEIWAQKNFACAWFHLSAKLPADVENRELYLDFQNEGEALLVDSTGSALKGFTFGSPVFGVVDPFVEKRYYPIEELIDDQGNIDLYIDGASNSILGEYHQDYSRLRSAAVVRCNAQLQDIYYDFDVLLDYVTSLDMDNPHKLEILYGLRSVWNLIVYEDPDMYEKSKQITSRLLQLSGNEEIQATAVGHAHLDLAWLWPIRESYRKAKRTLANMIYLVERHPEFSFVIPQPQQLEWIREQDPKLYEKIKKYEKEGRVEIVGGGWVENDTNIPCDESLVRQELYGQKFWQEEFGHYVKLRWLPDTFGYTGCLPQILKLSGQDNFMTIKISWSNRTVFPYNTFRWAGIDGSEVTVHMPTEGNYNSAAGPKALLAAKKGLKTTDPQDKMMIVYGVGDGGGGPSENMVQRNLRTGAVPYLPKVKMGSAQGYFDRLDPAQLPLYSGEMYLEKHRATYTSQSNNKNFNRDFEEKMLSLEKLLAGLGLQGDKQQMDRLWKEALLYQFHDILPGSSIKRVYEETDAAYGKILAELEKLAQQQGASFEPDGGPMINLDNQPVRKLVKCGEDYLLYQGSGSLIQPIRYTAPKVLGSLNRVETDNYIAEFAEDGSFRQISLRKTGEVITRWANRLRVFIDIGDAWDFEDDYRDQKEQYMELIHTGTRDFGDLVEVTQTYRFKNSSLVQTLVMHKQLPYISVFHDVDWKDSGYMLRSELLPQVWDSVVRSDIQFGYLERPTTDEDAHQRAQFEICCQKWFDISESDKGLAVLNNAKNGFMAKNGLISLTALRSTDYPCVRGDQKRSCYSYALYPHAGGFDPVLVDELAEQFGSRALYGQSIVEQPSFDNPQIRLTAFKPAYDGNGFILRAFERTGKEAGAKLTLPEGYVLSHEVNLLEDPIGNIQPEMEFKPFQIRSFRLIKA